MLCEETDEGWRNHLADMRIDGVSSFRLGLALEREVCL